MKSWMHYLMDVPTVTFFQHAMITLTFGTALVICVHQNHKLREELARLKTPTVERVEDAK